MEFKKNSLREKIRRGETALGTALYSFSPALIEDRHHSNCATVHPMTCKSTTIVSEQSN